MKWTVVVGIAAVVPPAAFFCADFCLATGGVLGYLLLAAGTMLSAAAESVRQLFRED